MLSSGLKDLSKDELVGLVEQLLAEVSALRERVCALEAENAAVPSQISVELERAPTSGHSYPARVANCWKGERSV